MNLIYTILTHACKVSYNELMADSISPVAVGFFVLITVWLALVTYYFYKFVSHFNSLIKNTNRKSLQDAFQKVIEEAKFSQQNVQALNKRLDQQEKKAEETIQNVSLVRFNPFENTGGLESFVVTLLDHNKSGILFTSLQSRTGTRWYAKKIKMGKGVDYDLSKEEKEAVDKAKPL